MLVLLFKWAKGQGNAGGFAKAKDKKMALAVLTSLVTHGVRQPFKLQVELIDEWCLLWPRPRPTAEEDMIEIMIQPGGIVDFSAWRQLFSCRLQDPEVRKVHPITSRWFVQCSPHLNTNYCLPILDTPLKKQKADQVSLDKSLWRQIFYLCARHVEVCQLVC